MKYLVTSFHFFLQPVQWVQAYYQLDGKWKHLFQLTTTLLFEESYAASKATGEERRTRKGSFKKFVYIVLALHQKPSIYEFSLKCQNSYGSSHLNVWNYGSVRQYWRKLIQNTVYHFAYSILKHLWYYKLLLIWTLKFRIWYVCHALMYFLLKHSDFLSETQLQGSFLVVHLSKYWHSMTLDSQVVMLAFILPLLRNWFLQCMDSGWFPSFFYRYEPQRLS